MDRHISSAIAAAMTNDGTKRHGAVLLRGGNELAWASNDVYHHAEINACRSVWVQTA